MRKLGWLLAAVFGTLGLVFAVWTTIHERTRRMKMIPLASLSLKSYAFGRFVIDLPAGVRMVNWKQGYSGAGPITVSEGTSLGRFETIVKQRVDELRAVPHEAGGTLFEQEDKLSLPHSREILYWDNALLKQELECDAYYQVGTTLFKINPSTNPDSKSKNEMKDANEDIFKNIRLRSPDEVPSEPGFCFEGAILTLDITPCLECHSERVMVDIAWEDRPDVHFSFTTFTNGEMLDPPLLERLKDAGNDPGEKILRSRPRMVGPFHGEEHLTRAKEKNGTEGHLFIWEAEGVPNDPFNPQIRVDMTSGDGPNGAENASLSDQDALRLWDAIVSSIRIRPTTKISTGPGVAAAAVPPRPRTALGTRLKSGERCTQAGIWTCAHGGNLGGAKRVFREGEELPAAVLDTHRRWLGKLTGRPAETVVDTFWTLEGYPDEA